MDINNLTLGEIKQLQCIIGAKAESCSEMIANVGQAVFIRTVTHHYTGCVTTCNKDWLELEDAAWIADDGRFNNFLKTGEANEIEPYVNPVRIPLGCVLDITLWEHALPRAVK